MKRSRGRGRRPQNSHNRSFDSAGPDIKIRGTAAQVYEKYLQLARDANSAGDRIQAENYLQHAEHYFRILQVTQAAQAAANPNGNGDAKGANGNGNDGGSESAPSFSLAEGAEDEEVA